jgi:hypothetical protein
MICFYHKGDLDGHCSGAIVRLCFPNALMVGIDYEDPFPWDLPQIQGDSEGVIMADFSLPIEEMRRLYHFSQRFVWIDHHKTAIDQAGEAGFDPPGLRIVGKAACELTWRYFFSNNPMPPAVHLLGRYDVWDEKQPDWDTKILPFQYGLRIYPTDPSESASDALWPFLLDYRNPGNLVEEISKVGLSILTYQYQQDAKLMARHAFGSVFANLPALIVNHGPGSSMKFEAWAEVGDYPLLISFARLPQYKWLVNLYTYREDVDVGAIAQAHGGGGHRKAAGFICDELPFEI